VRQLVKRERGVIRKKRGRLKKIAPPSSSRRGEKDRASTRRRRAGERVRG